MACYVPFNSRNLDISFFSFRPTVVYVDDLIHILKQISRYTESLGCVHSSIFKSIHGNLIVWYGAWMKRSDENKELLSATLLSLLKDVTKMAILVEHSFFDAYAGESRDGSPAAKFFTGDIVCLSSVTLSTHNKSINNSISYAFLAIFKDRFLKMGGAKSGTCFRSQTLPQILSLVVWQSLQSCYTFILTSDYRRNVLPYLEDLPLDMKYDVFRVVYVSSEGDVMDHVPQLSPQKKRVLGNDQVEKNEQTSCRN